MEQVRLEDGVVFVELSEEVREDVLRPTLNQALVLENLTQGGAVPLALELPVTQGRRARHRLELTLDVPVESLPDEGDSLRLTIPGSGLEDLFGNRAASDPDPVQLTWSASGLDVPVDMTRPRLVEACVKGGNLRLVFSEPPAPANARVQLTLDGVEDDESWTVLPDGYTVEHALTAGAHVLELGTGSFDLVGKALEATPPSLTIPDNTDQQLCDEVQQLCNSGLPGEIGIEEGKRAPESAIGNPFGFHGLPVDEETGLVYVRNRYYDPELSRFLQTDPYGYADSANLYQFALNDPVNNSDPTGLCVVDYAWDAASIGLGYWSFQRNLEEENFGAAIWDAVGITVDSVALSVPCAPGGVGTATNAVRAIRGAQGLFGLADVGQGLYQGAVAAGQGEYDAVLLNALLGGVGAYFGGREVQANFGGLFSAKVAGVGSGGFPVQTGVRAGGLSGGGGGGVLAGDHRTVLMVGEGNLSYSRALVEAGEVNPRTLTATVYENELVGDAVENAAILRGMGVEVRTGVDGTNLAATFGTHQFDDIRFHFPHTGSDISSNQRLLRSFFRSAKGQISTGGKVHITLSDYRLYNRFGVISSAGKAGFRRLFVRRFDSSKYPRYRHEQTRRPGVSTPASRTGLIHTFGV